MQSVYIAISGTRKESLIGTFKLPSTVWSDVRSKCFSSEPGAVWNISKDELKEVYHGKR